MVSPVNVAKWLGKPASDMVARKTSLLCVVGVLFTALSFPLPHSLSLSPSLSLSLLSSSLSLSLLSPLYLSLSLSSLSLSPSPPLPPSLCVSLLTPFLVPAPQSVVIATSSSPPYKAGSDLQLTCTVTLPNLNLNYDKISAQITWTKGDHPINISNPRISVEDSVPAGTRGFNTSLSIHSAIRQTQDTMCVTWSCPLMIRTSQVF